jgi:hypothetical protein
MQPAELWITLDRSQFFLVPGGRDLLLGPLVLANLKGARRFVAPDEARPYEITEDQARRWARDELGKTLDELKQGIDEKLTDLRQHLEDFNNHPVGTRGTVTPNAASALFNLIKQFPHILRQSLSGDDNRVHRAREEMADLRRQLTASGIEIDERFSNFPARLADLRRNSWEAQSAKNPRGKDPGPNSNQ